MTATDELRAMLDERGVEWWPSDDPCCEDIITHWRVGQIQWTAIEGEKDLWLNAGIAGYEPFTPAQAIAATLGERKNAIPTNPHATCVVLEGENPPEEVLFHGPDKVTHYLPERTCHNVHEPPKDTTFWPAPHFKCSECGHKHVSMNYVYFCPNCGRKVVDE